VLADDLQGGELVPARLAAVLATLPKKERKQFRATWYYVRSTLYVANLVLNDPRPGLDQASQFEDLIAFAIWRLRLIRRAIRRARLGQPEEVLT
jgi:hypothetical protein